MCSVRCPIEVEKQDGKVTWIQGNPHSALKGGLCARGAAGIVLERDSERPTTPLIRVGARGEGKWREASWDEALDYVADRLKTITAEHGNRSVLWSDRGGPFVDLHQAFVRGIGSPNYCNHDASCARNVQHAAQSVLGMGRKMVSYDFRNAKHIILQTRNILEAINVAECNAVMDALGKGTKLTVIDIRASVSGSKADNFFMVRPGTDYAFNLAVINELLTKKLYNAEYVANKVTGLEELEAFVAPYTAEWAAGETGIPAERIAAFAKELAEAAPNVIWHPGWMVARYNDSFNVCRTAYIINALLGSVGVKGGLPLVNTPKDVGRKGLTKLVDLFPKPEEKRADGVGWKDKHTQFDGGPGLVNLAYDAIATGDPYPVKAYLCFRHDPLMAMPDPEAQKKKWEALDLLVSITFSWSDTAWHSDVVLPLSPYLSRESIIAGKSGPKPQFFVRKRAMEPTQNTRADWEILGGLAARLADSHPGMEKLAFKTIEELWAHQLQGTGVSIEDFAAKGFVELADAPLVREVESFPTPSGKLEMLSGKWSKAGIDTLKPYASPAKPPAGMFRIAFGRVGVHTQGHTVNNPLLNEQMPENVAWMHVSRAAELGIADGDTVEILTNGAPAGTMKAFVTECIHPEALFMVHGFGHRLSVETRACGKGVADHELMAGGLEKWDRSGGGLSLQEHFVAVRKA